MLWEEQHVVSIASSFGEITKDPNRGEGKGKGNENRMPGEYSGRPSPGHG